MTNYTRLLRQKGLLPEKTVANEGPIPKDEFRRRSWRAASLRNALFLVQQVRRAAGLEVFDVRGPTGGDLGGGGTVLYHRAEPVHAGEEYKEVVLTEELIAHIQITVGIDDIFKIDLFSPDVGERLAAKVDAVALLTQELRAFRTRNASRHKGEGISRHRRMPVDLERELRAAAEADHRALEVTG